MATAAKLKVTYLKTGKEKEFKFAFFHSLALDMYQTLLMDPTVRVELLFSPERQQMNLINRTLLLKSLSSSGNRS